MWVFCCVINSGVGWRRAGAKERQHTGGERKRKTEKTRGRERRREMCGRCLCLVYVVLARASNNLHRVLNMTCRRSYFWRRASAAAAAAATAAAVIATGAGAAAAAAAAAAIMLILPYPCPLASLHTPCTQCVMLCLIRCSKALTLPSTSRSPPAPPPLSPPQSFGVAAIHDMGKGVVEASV